jgi:cholinesterase
VVDLYGPDYLLREDLVYITINYRIGPIGFLSLEDPELGIPGNAGLKDQVFALKWVQRNIANFGGNPDQVTVFGNSVRIAELK